MHELRELQYENSIVLPVVHKRMVTSLLGRNSFSYFGMPIYIALTGDERRDYRKIYEKIRRRYSQFSEALEFQREVPETLCYDGKTLKVNSDQRSVHNSDPTPSYDAIGGRYRYAHRIPEARQLTRPGEIP